METFIAVDVGFIHWWTPAEVTSPTTPSMYD